LTLFVGAYAETKGINVDSLKNELRQEIVNNDAQIRQSQKDSIMLSKLSPNQLADLKKQELEVQKQRVENEGRSDMPFTSFQLFLIVLFPFLFVPTIIYIIVNAKKEESKRKYELYSKSLEMGQTVPEHFFDQPKVNSSSNMKKGILWLAVGLAILIYFVVIHKNNALIVGIIPTFLGIGYLLVHYLDKPKTDAIANNNEQNG
jgi:large-conductance mechanosensitive channel